jgi:hypothetical protein
VFAIMNEIGAPGSASPAALADIEVLRARNTPGGRPLDYFFSPPDGYKGHIAERQIVLSTTVASVSEPQA